MRISFFIVLFWSQLGITQIALESSFNSVHIGRNQSLMLNYHFNKFQVGLGLKYNFNKLVNFPEKVFYKKTFYAINDKEHFGLEWNFKYRIFNKEHVKIHAFYNGQFSKSHTRFVGYQAVGPPLVENPTSDLDYLLQKHITLFGPFLVVENNIGLAFDIFVTKNLYFAQKFGAGIVLFKNLDQNTNILVGNWELSEMLSFGIGFKFNDKGLK